ncbi:HAD-IIIC family phosphatase [Actinomadura sp. 9N215]|uniref:HAD-IIIC family phosphatase n=1 Tax=Actinomadura sp. 9N215 TaxID=3375150 RepID=UPI0037AEDFC3
MGSPALVKCLVWDLDNTLWDGTLLEDGAVPPRDGVADVIAALDARGILQSVSSKNDHDLAWARLTELGLAEYFVFPQIGWGRKPDAVIRIAERLRFALGTMAFVDDTPAERAEVRFHAPEVRCYTPEQIPELVSLPEFSPATVTVDARRRRTMYRAGFEREAAQAEFDGPDEEFLRSLKVEMRIARATGDLLSRVEELTLRTSQMNATGVHYSDAELRGLLADPRHEVLVTTVSDRFGPYGAVGVLLLERHGPVWHLKLLATSCRVVSLGAGSAILGWLSGQAARAGVHLVADFRATERNRMMEVAYRFAGFGDAACACRDAVAPAAPEIQRLHLTPVEQPPPAALRLEAPDLAAGAGRARLSRTASAPG